jgi:curli biogenesis system outer membrane secretion channel CsgG
MTSLKKIALAAALALAASPAAAGNMDELFDDALSSLNKSLAGVPASVSRISVARVDMPEGGITPQQAADRINATLMEGGRFAVVDRAALGRLLEEQRLSLSGLVDTAQMVSAGKVTGVQGFLFGSASLDGGNLVLDLKLVDVETSAIIFARKFTGEPHSKGRFAAGWLYANTAFGTELRWNKPSSPVSTAELEGDAASPAAFSLSYVQGFKKNRALKFGADLAYTSFSDLSGGNRRIDNPGESYVAFHDMEVTRVTVTPKVYFSAGRLLGVKGNSFSPYIGAAFSYTNFSLYFDADNYGAPRPKEEAEVDASVIGVAPVAGAEFNFTRNLAAYAEVSFAPEMAFSAGRKVIVSDIEMESFPYAASGVNWNFGVKYYFDLF